MNRDAATLPMNQVRTADATVGRLGLLGRSPIHGKLLDQLCKVSRTNAEVLITGPTGVGKELYARFLHECSDRREAQFVAVNCGAMPDGLFENELFGHMAGAFTGAQAHTDGLVAAAEGGTLFLDEIDALTIPAQVKLLRLLQEKEYRRLGETRVRRADVRFVAATNADLMARVKEGRFREDLLFRVRVIPVQIPPLCERREDIAVLVVAFLERYSKSYGLPPAELSAAAWERLSLYQWPGNIRELENCVRSLICLQLDRPVGPEDLSLLADGEPPKGRPSSTRDDVLAKGLRDSKREIVEQFEVDYLEASLRRTRGNIAEAAKIACKHRRAYFELLRKYDIDPRGYRIVSPDGAAPLS